MPQLTPRRLWFLIGAVGCLAVVAVGYSLFVSGAKSERSDLAGQSADAQVQTAANRSKLAALQADNKNLPKYKTQLAALTSALPTAPSTPQFVSDMQALSRRTGVVLTSLSVTPATSAGTSTIAQVGGANPLPVTISATGPTLSLERFLTLVQTKEMRAISVMTVTETAPIATGASASDADPTIAIIGNAFYRGS